MDILHITVLSAVEGITEFLPISSTAHLILTSHLLQIPSSDFLSTFEITIQLGAILSVIFLYFQKILKNKKLFYKAVIGFIPTGILGFTLFKIIKGFLENPYIPVASLFIGGLAIILIEMYFSKEAKNQKRNAKSLTDLSYKDALWIGLIQSVAMIPGVSRSAASIFGAMALKFDREAAVEFSFLLAIPTMIAATGFDLLKSVKTLHSSDLSYILIGSVLSFIFALLAIKWLLKFISKNNFIGFGIYRIVLSVLYFILFLR